MENIKMKKKEQSGKAENLPAKNKSPIRKIKNSTL